MLNLVDKAIEAHGGLEQWRTVGSVSAHARLGGPALEQRALAFTQLPTVVTVETGRQRAAFEPFVSSDRRAVYEPDHTLVEALDGSDMTELNHPRESFAAWNGTSPWSETQIAYFAGYAFWTYLNLPFVLANGEIACQEIAPLVDGDETWRALSVVFPATYATHSAKQTLYFDGAGLMRRNDYTVEISGGVEVAHYLHDHRTFGGIVFPTCRRVHLRNPDRSANKDFAIITADLDRFQLSKRR